MLSERIGPLSEARLAHIVKSLADGVAIQDLDGRFFLVNPAAMTILGMSSTDGCQQLAAGGGGAGQTAAPMPEWPSSCGFFRSDTVTPCLPEDLPLARSRRGETLHDVQVFIRGGTAPGGAWLSIDSTPLRNDVGAIEGSVMVFRDVTVKKREIERMELLSNVVEQTADSVLVTDRDGRIEYVNPACEATTGYSRAELLGRTPAIFKSGVHGRDFYTDLWRTLVGGQVFRGIITDRKKSGELYPSQQTITPIRWHGEPMTHLVSVARDITGLRKAAEREHELLLARSVQQRLYPAAPPTVPGFDISGAAFVADVTGGDYFDFLALPGECTGIVIGDVSGHGFDSALLMAETRAVLRSTIHIKSDPGEILGIINRVLAADMEENRFVTMLLACLHGPTGRFTYASAGHGGYLLDGSGAIKTELTATGLPLGMFANATYETSAEITLEPAEMLLLLTDGVMDSEAPDQAPFGVERILDVVRSCRGERAREVVAKVYREARAFQHGAPQQDDMTIVVCTANVSANAE